MILLQSFKNIIGNIVAVQFVNSILCRYTPYVKFETCYTAINDLHQLVFQNNITYLPIGFRMALSLIVVKGNFSALLISIIIQSYRMDTK